VQGDSFRLASYTGPDGSARAGIVVDEQIVDVAPSVLSILASWDTEGPRLRRLAGDVRSGSMSPEAHVASPLRQVTLLPPVIYPGAIFCAGANYKDHVREMSRALSLPEEPDPHELGLKPWHFIKPAAPCVRGTGERIPLPAYSRRVDWEAEIALVIGRPCRNVGIDEALGYVAGLTIVNDLSARDHLKRDSVPADSPFRFDWVSQKCFEGALPMGPWITPLEDIEDIDNIGIELRVNEELMQSSSSVNLIFSFAEQIAHLSTRVTLRPGDVIATGTPAGCGAARGRFLQHGDRIRIWVQGVGELHNEFVA